MEDIKIDLKELKGLYEKSKEPRVTKHPFFPSYTICLLFVC